MNPIFTYEAETKTWKGAEVPFPFAGKGVPEVVFDAMTKYLDHVCQISDDTGVIYTNEKMLKTAISFATALKYEFRIRKGDHVLLMTENYHYMAGTWLGCAFAQAVLCPFVFSEGTSVKDEVMNLLRQIAPKLLVMTDVTQVESFKKILKDLGMDIPILMYENKIEGCHDLKPHLEADIDISCFKVPRVEDPENTTFMLTLSSGTTAQSKLTITTHQQLLGCWLNGPIKMVGASTLRPGWQSEGLTLFHSFIGTHTRVIRAQQDIDSFLRIVQKHKVHLAFMAPKDIYAAIRSPVIKEVDLSSLRLISSGGNHLSDKIRMEFQKYIPKGTVNSSYGISDLCSKIAAAPVGTIAKPGSVGKVAKNMEVRVIDDDGKRLGPGEIGEFHVKPTVTKFVGYYNNPELTKNSIDEDGFFKTGDVGKIDEEGNVFIVDRKKYLITYRGNWINTSQIEKIVLENVEGIEGVCVVDMEDAENGIIPIITVQPETGVSLDAKDIIATVHKHHEIKFETKVFFFESLPITISGKYIKYRIREMVKQLMA
ncbi:uncharacterized protein LOC134833444 [Culicoides brevitarsis]|uniref:uncharacterized protein LOC134833444 n=1 Tax=Culicoides brevitarsis TaxID=469753 RepID=UPI00307C6A73